MQPSFADTPIQGAFSSICPCPGARNDALQAPDLINWCEAVAGSFFDSLPGGGDVYLLKKVIHDWDDERARTILANCRAAMDAKGRVILLEQVIPPGNGASFAKLMDLQMLVHTPGGRERSDAEYGARLASAGLKLIGIAPTASPLSIIEAVAA